MRSRLSLLGAIGPLVLAHCMGDDPATVNARDAGSDATMTGTAAIEVWCNGAPMVTLGCPSKRWEWNFTCRSDAGGIGWDGVLVELRNAGRYPIAYTVREGWADDAKYVPGKPSDGSELYGTLEPGATADVSSRFNGGIFALVGSVRPFAEQAYSAPKDDEGTIPWPDGALGTFAADHLFVSQLSTYTAFGQQCLAAKKHF